jgi:cytochrome P450
MFAAGVETTANTLEFAILYMALNPTVQQKIQEEIDRVIGKSGTVTLKDKPRHNSTTFYI